MSYNIKFGSGEYAPTPSHMLPAFTGGQPSGYMCIRCGHLTKDLDPIFDDLCLICLKDWAIKMGVSRVIPTAEALNREALEPSEKIEKPLSEATTIIVNLNKQSHDLKNGYTKINREIPALEKINKDV